MAAVRLAFTRRWLGIFLFATVFAAVSVALGEWQFDRRDYAQQQIALLNANYDLPAAPIGSVIGELDAVPGEETWRSVELTGRYLSEHTTYVRNRVKQGTIGFEQLIPFQLDTGEIVIVDRGWLPADDKYENPRVTPEAPDGEVTVISRLYPDEAVVEGRSAPDGQIATINVDSIAQRLNAPAFTGLYGQLVSESPVSVTGSLWDRPLLDEGPHLSYALQWYVFALMGYFGYGWALVNEARGESPKKEPSRRRERTAERKTDEDIEDAAIEAVSR